MMERYLHTILRLHGIVLQLAQGHLYLYFTFILLDILFQTSYSTAIAVYYLAKNPDKQQKLLEEILRYLPEKDQPVTSEILTELKYLKACIKESMRYQSKLTS
jgi:hypothetical protein